MTLLRRVPATLAALLLGAHFFRAGQVVVAAVCALAPILLFLPVPRVLFVFRLLLAAAAGVWIHTAWRIAELRRQAGEPYLRMLLILGAVAVLTLAAAAVLPKEKPRA